MAQETTTVLTAPTNTSEDAVASDADLATRAIEILKGGRIVTLPEPAQRSRSYRELILQEMNWMASDYYHERRWKLHAGKQISIGIKEAIMDRKRLNKNWIANECSAHVKRFWANIINKTGRYRPVSDEMTQYCHNIANRYLKHLQTDMGDPSKDYEIGERDLIAIMVPPLMQHDNAYTEITPINKNDVLEATILRMQSMGAELYRPLFRPPDDEMDMFTMPLMDPARDSDFNSLLVQSFCVKKWNQALIKQDETTTDNDEQSEDIDRDFTRENCDPSCLAISLRDFDMQLRPKPLLQGYMVKTELLAVEFELLDSWMLQQPPSWPMYAICLTYRSSASGLYRFEFSVEFCKETYETLKRHPRGLVNSSRRLLGPRQRNAITTFLDAPPKKRHFVPIAPSQKDAKRIKNKIKTKYKIYNKKTKKRYKIYTRKKKSIITKKRNRTQGLKDMYIRQKKKTFLTKKSDNIIVDTCYIQNAQKVKNGKITHSKIHKNGFKNTKPHPNGLKTQLTNGKISAIRQDKDLQLALRFSKVMNTNAKVRNGTVVHCKKGFTVARLKETICKEKRLLVAKVARGNPKRKGFRLPQNARMEVALASKKRVKPSYESNKKIEVIPLVPDMPYGEYSNRMSKQLRVGFLGIPAKMFAHSLFYSGRFSKNNRVRRVSLTISNTGKTVMPQPNVLYARLFEQDVGGMFGRFRTQNWQRNATCVPDPHGELLLKKYTNELMNAADKKSKPQNEFKPVEILAAYVNMKLTRGECKAQSTLGPTKIPLKNIEQVVHNAQPPPPQNNQTTSQTRTGGNMPMTHIKIQAHGVSPRGTAQNAVVHTAVPINNMQNSHMQLHHQQMQQASMPPAPNPTGQMGHVPMMTGGMQQGHMAPGQIMPMKMAQGQVPPGSMPGMPQAGMPQAGMHPGQMTPGKVPPGPIPGMPTQMQMNMEQMKRRPPMDMPGKRRPMMPYEHMYPPQVQPMQYRYRPMPDVNMMRMPMYPMPMYNKQVPYPKAHEDPYRAQHMQR
ncbi:Uncharacterized protein BXIN_2752 [Babesia sp. Xinjiang]|uniref:Uncharacterized protein n=1 Tax=Babesia sp. Xinjiang TaxID=462227 RepID=UPI000A264387|nr:Uncharacterized protein BXIN_2752 [Babesia sp. Xinjiang]ORM41707.1 Uncharacterized protein BXIN_2752 [Babesia sp. Xinjiang]